ncbi:hypothetical protein Tco_0397295 [Tanacetum coccineum]
MYNLQQNLYLFSWEERLIDMVPHKVKLQLPKPTEVSIKESKDSTVLKNLEDEATSSKLLKECGKRVKKYGGSRVNVKRKSTQDQVPRKKMFEVDEAIDGENSRASSF